jgi:hypothetical protein
MEYAKQAPSQHTANTGGESHLLNRGGQMSRSKKLVLALVAATALAASIGAGSASATVLCKSSQASHICPTSERYTKGTPVELTLAPGSLIVSQMGEFVPKCSQATAKGVISNEGGKGQPVEVAINERTITGCNSEECHVSFFTARLGKIEVSWESGTQNGAVSEIWEATVQCGTLKPCTVAPVEHERGPALLGGSSATLSWEPMVVWKVEGKSTCNFFQNWTGAFKITSPASVYVASE